MRRLICGNDIRREWREEMKEVRVKVNLQLGKGMKQKVIGKI